jgi:hypothetical protein
MSVAGQGKAKRRRAQRRAPLSRGGRRIVRAIVSVVICVGVGTAVGFVLKDRLSTGPAIAESGTTSRGDLIVDPDEAPDTTVAAVIENPVDPTVARFAWDSTCQLAVAGIASRNGPQIIQGLQRAHEHADLFEDGIVPEDVSTALDAGYEGIVKPQEIGGEAAGTEETNSIGAIVEAACAAWSRRINAG